MIKIDINTIKEPVNFGFILLNYASYGHSIYMENLDLHNEYIIIEDNMYRENCYLIKSHVYINTEVLTLFGYPNTDFIKSIRIIMEKDKLLNLNFIDGPYYKNVYHPLIDNEITESYVEGVIKYKENYYHKQIKIFDNRYPCYKPFN